MMMLFVGSDAQHKELTVRTLTPTSPPEPTTRSSPLHVLLWLSGKAKKEHVFVSEDENRNKSQEGK